MGGVGQQSAGTLLPADPCGAHAVGGRNTRLEPDGGHHREIFYCKRGGLVMRSLRRFFTRLFNLAGNREHEQRLKEEIAEHLALETEENLRADYLRLRRVARLC